MSRIITELTHLLLNPFAIIVLGAVLGIFLSRNSLFEDDVDSPKGSSFAPIILFALLGLGCAGEAARMFTGACGKAALVGGASVFWGSLRITAEQCRDLSKNPPWLLLSGIAAAPSILLTWYWRDRKRRADQRTATRERVAAERQHRLNEQVAFSQRYTTAAELLGSPDEMIRINGLEALFDIARQSEDQRAAVSRTLAAFVRVRCHAPRAPADPDKSFVPKPAADVQTAMTLLGNPQWRAWEREQSELDLRDTDLSGFELAGAVLSKANLIDAHMVEVVLDNADLRGASLDRAFIMGSFEGADLTGARLTRAKLGFANFKSAQFVGANLTGAMLEEANLENANLYAANLEEADLTGANLRGADLREAKTSPADF
jgi:uncharacterized protein YjbI with pentapeptide repeats